MFYHLTFCGRMSELKNFILRHEAVKLYRTFLKSIKEAPKESHGELREQVRREFAGVKLPDDPYAMKYALSQGREQLKQLQEMLAMQR